MSSKTMIESNPPILFCFWEPLFHMISSIVPVYHGVFISWKREWLQAKIVWWKNKIQFNLNDLAFGARCSVLGCLHTFGQIVYDYIMLYILYFSKNRPFLTFRKFRFWTWNVWVFISYVTWNILSSVKALLTLIARKTLESQPVFRI